MTSTRVVSITGLATLVLSLAAAGSPPPRELDPCTLLSTADATTALEQPSLPGKQDTPPTGCFWSHDSPRSDTSRQIWIATHTPSAFNIAKRPASPAIKVETISGLGDDAFYQMYPAPAPPFLWLKKGDKAISIRVITRWKNAPFTQDQEKAKLLVLGKAAAAKM